jgi:hypothetical protein
LESNPDGLFVIQNGEEGPMSNKNYKSWKTCLGTMVVIVGCVLTLAADVPQGWFVAGSKPSDFEAGVDPGQAYEGHRSAFLKSKQTSVNGFGTLMQQFTADQYKGSRVRLSALVKSHEVTEWAGLWVRADKGKDAVAFDNMQNRAIKGTTEWRRYEIVLDVPKDATGVALGILLTGPGEVWMNGARFEVVGSDIPVTSSNQTKIPDKPVNLDFAE